MNRLNKGKENEKQDCIKQVWQKVNKNKVNKRNGSEEVARNIMMKQVEKEVTEKDANEANKSLQLEVNKSKNDAQACSVTTTNKFQLLQTEIEEVEVLEINEVEVGEITTEVNAGKQCSVGNIVSVTSNVVVEHCDGEGTMENKHKTIDENTYEVCIEENSFELELTNDSGKQVLHDTTDTNETDMDREWCTNFEKQVNNLIQQMYVNSVVEPNSQTIPYNFSIDLPGWPSNPTSHTSSFAPPPVTKPTNSFSQSPSPSSQPIRTIETRSLSAKRRHNKTKPQSC